MTRRHLLIISGALAIIFVIAPAVTYGIWQVQARRAVVALEDDSAVLLRPQEGDAQPAPGEEQQAPAPRKIPAPQASGTLRIASAGIVMPIYEGTSGSLLYWGAWRSPWNEAAPGEPGNVVIFGHRYLNIPPSKNTMWNLNRVIEGDVVEIEWSGQTFRYRITGSRVVTPDQVSVLAETPGPTLTLITCTPLFSTENRLVVTAELIE